MYSKLFSDSVSRFSSLYVIGNSSLLSSDYQNSRVSVSGARKIDSESSEWLKSIVNQLNHNNILVSGLAIGTDTIAHKTALANGVKQIAVLPCGLNNIYPRQNLKIAKQILQSGGCLVSQLPLNQKPNRNSFVNRNQVIADLGQILIVPQCNIKSGTMHTINFARALKKPIIVQNSNYSGNQFILQDYPMAISK